MKNIEFYKDKLSGLLNPDAMYFFALDHGAKCVLKINPDTREGNIDNESFVEWLLEEHQILSETEKEYLSNFVKPLKTDKTKIVKRYHKDPSSGTECECIEICDLKDEIFISKNISIYLPFFKAGTMYKEMALDKEYSLEDLGL